MKKKIKKDESVGFVRRKLQAIDFTPIYEIYITANLKTGSILRFDTASDKIEIVNYIPTNKA